METTLMLYLLGCLSAAVASPHLVRRWQLSRAKHPSLTGHVRMAKRLSGQLPYYHYTTPEVFNLDRAPAEVGQRRALAFERLASDLARRFDQSRALTRQASPQIADLQFTGAYRVPFQFRELVRGKLDFGSFVRATRGEQLIDLDGNELIDVTGSYGVNLLGHDFYKRCIHEANQRVAELGPLLGSYHPIVADVVSRLTAISGKQEVSFHMSGTEAVMQAVRLARYHTGRPRLVRFCGAYHGWWDDVQPGVGNPMPPGQSFTLRELDERTLKVLRTRRDIACVLVNPLQALHPNQAAPSDTSLVDGLRQARFDRPRYTQWLQDLRKVCDERGIVLILDEVFVGFRLAPGGAQEYFGVSADLVTYGKTLGGGLPVGVLCGSHALMRRYRDHRPADICFARGTFNSHPYVMAAMQIFLEHITSAPARLLYDGLDARWDRRAEHLNQRLAAADVPVQLANLSTIWTVNFVHASRYNWLLQYYLRQQGIALSWVGTGRLIFSLAFSETEFDEFASRFVKAAVLMREDGWWWGDERQSARQIRREVMKEMLAHRFGWAGKKLGRNGQGVAPAPAYRR